MQGARVLSLVRETRSHTLQLRVHMLQLKILCVTTKTQHSQINKSEYYKTKLVTSLSALPRNQIILQSKTHYHTQNKQNIPGIEIIELFFMDLRKWPLRWSWYKYCRSIYFIHCPSAPVQAWAKLVKGIQGLGNGTLQLYGSNSFAWSENNSSKTKWAHDIPDSFC